MAASNTEEKKVPDDRRAYSMAKLDFWFEEASTGATNPSHNWLADLSFFECINQRILIPTTQLSQNNNKFDLLPHPQKMC